MHNGDATELFVLERAGVSRPADLVIAVTGDDEDNLVIGQLAREKYGVERVIARVNDPGTSTSSTCSRSRRRCPPPG